MAHMTAPGGRGQVEKADLVVTTIWAHLQLDNLIVTNWELNGCRTSAALLLLELPGAAGRIPERRIVREV